MPELVTAQAAATPNAMAAMTDKQTLSYRDLDAQSNQLAHYLRSLGVSAEVLVGICMERSPAMIVAALAVWKAGGAYIPMDPAYPAERLAFILRDAQAPVLVGMQCQIDRLQGASPRTVALDTEAARLAAQPTEPLAGRVAPDDAAYVVYTSGSTGEPKGVLITHDGLLNLVLWHRRAFAIGAEDRATQLAGPGFDAVVWEIWPYLTVGAGILLPDDETRLSAAMLRDWFIAKQITITFLPTALAEAVMVLDWPQEIALRILLTGAEALRRYPSPNLPFAVVNNYGPSENTVVTTSGEVLPTERADRPPTIGRPIDHVQVYILDKHLRPVASGAVGELCIGGSSLARGYLHRPELTAERFVINPAGEAPGARIFRTGDQARLLPDGQIDFLGRLDGQVKIRGYRIETEEIVAALNRHASIQTSAVTAREDTPGEKRLTAYIIQGGESLPSLGELRDFLANRLPDYMVPAHFVPLNALPLTPNGKVDIAALPPPDAANTLQDTAYMAPRTPTEERVAGILAEVLKLNRVGIEDNFFMLGGHSLLGTQVITRVANAFGVELSLYTLFAA
ncbi:MAG: non-ribosomal peptide synthetase, partial [Chloroflexota bacterium]